MKRVLTILLCLILLCAGTALPASAAVDGTTRSLIDSASLTPLVTGYTELDQIVADFFASNFSETSDTFEKLKICYDFLIYGSEYGSSSVTTALYNAIDRECNYYSMFDRDYVAEGYAFITDKRGSCNHFAAAFMVMARAIGLDCYVMHGTITWYAGTTPHYWNEIHLGSAFYIFDVEAEWRNYDNNGTVSYSNFCIPESLNSSRSCNRTECVNEFGNFQCRNKVNNPGTVIPGKPSVVTNVYDVGNYLINESMNFRSDHSLASGIFSVLPSGITVTVTEVNGIWGKITYDGTTGWISLDYSTKLRDQEEEKEGYQPGKYVTNDAMNFRSEPSVTGKIYYVIPSGTTLNVTEINGTWGKTTYRGRTGWLSLDWSTYLPNDEAALPAGPAVEISGDADGNGKLTAEDARLILRHSVSIEPINEAYVARADINADGKITPEDARLALRKSVHLS